MLLRVSSAANLELVRQLLQAHVYWRLKGLEVDLVIWNEDKGGYRQELQDQILGLVGASIEAHMLDRPGGVFVRVAHLITHEDRILIQSAARVVLSDEDGTLAAQVGRRAPSGHTPPLLSEAEPQWHSPQADENEPSTIVPSDGEDAWPFDAENQPLQFDNGLGAFSTDGREYVITLHEGAPTPAPWANVLANSQFGTVVSESAAGYTWFENAHEFRLTPWHNDPISDTSGEAIYLRDEETGHVWSPTPLPRRGSGAYRTRHGFGYSVYEHVEDGIASELWVFVGLHDAVKFSRLKLRNLSGRTRRLSVTGYVEWVLGELGASTRIHVVSEIDAGSGLLTARNSYNTEFEGRAAFFDVDVDADAEGRSHTADRAEFLGRNGHIGAPRALWRAHLSNRIGAGLDPCAAIQVPAVMAPEEVFETTFRLGAAADHASLVGLAERNKGAAAARDALAAVRNYWDHTLAALQVETPEPEVDVLVNGWLTYQTLASRCLARSGYYQSGGAFGFRDQLQDTMALAHIAPQSSREHLL
ncbi:MAG TPA: cyclic beta 1-2 glucan synthetase, partial [Wenzhouxiangella sp.]|nr:cyclic beta 1-2 glucan synthetase [Wenzhouxiangella sp.]